MRLALPRHRSTQRLALCSLALLGLTVAACQHGNAGAQTSAAPAIAATPAANRAAPKTDWALVPLTNDDVQLYLEVMRAAAARVRHPTPDDIVALKLEQSAMQKLQQGHPEQITPAEMDPDDHALMLHGHADELIVAARHLDAERYDHVVYRVEDAVVPPQEDFTADGDPMDAPYVPTAYARAFDAAQGANRKLLAPWRDEIRALETVVRQP